LAEKADISSNEAGAANIAADADAAGDDIAINKDSEGSSLTKKGPSEESNAPFAGKYNFGTGFDATSDGFGDATGINGWDATIDKLAHSNTMICNKKKAKVLTMILDTALMIPLVQMRRRRSKTRTRARTTRMCLVVPQQLSQATAKTFCHQRRRRSTTAAKRN
jgi:hypothetical protein